MPVPVWGDGPDNHSEYGESKASSPFHLALNVIGFSTVSLQREGLEPESVLRSYSLKAHIHILNNRLFRGLRNGGEEVKQGPSPESWCSGGRRVDGRHIDKQEHGR